MVNLKGIAVWILGFLTFVSILHVFDAALSCIAGYTNSLLNLYPFYPIIQDVFGDLNSARYFWVSMISAFFLFGVFSIVAYQDPLNTLIQRIISDAESENQLDEHLESSLTTLDMINHSLTHHSIDINEMKINLEALKDCINATKTEVLRLSAKIGSLEKERRKATKCPVYGKNVLPEFKRCPFCGEELSLHANISSIKDF